MEHPDEYIKGSTAERPSGHVLTSFSWKDNGGAIPSNMLKFSNSESNSRYLRYCKKFGIKAHPARYPKALPEFFIKLLTDEGDLVVDIFSGSNTTGMVAENLQRRWMSFDICQDYIASLSFRFAKSEEDAKMYYDEMMKGQDIII